MRSSASACIPLRFLPILVLAVSSLATRLVLAQTVTEAPLLFSSSPSAKPISRLRKKVELVLLPVSVLDRSDTSLPGLTPDRFSVLDDKIPQTVRYFSHEDAPIALSVVLDASASMANRFEDARSAMKALIAGSNPEDEFQVVSVGDQPTVLLQPCDSREEFEQNLGSLQPVGQTALWDSMMIALRQLRRAPFERKAMVVITDGGDNHSRTSLRELKSVLKEAGVAMYTVVLYNPFAARREEKLGPLELDELTSVTGGRVISARNRSEVLGAAVTISRELRDQYVLGYYPTHSSDAGKWHKVRVTVAGLDGFGKFRVFAKRGYFQSPD